MTNCRPIPAVALSVAFFLAASTISTRACAETSTAQQTDAKPLEAQQAFPPAFVVAGTPRERGLAYGKHFKDGIREFLDREIYEAFLDKPSSKEEMLQYAAACGKVAQEVCPMIAEECEGIAEGAGLSFDEVVLINAHEEIYHRSALPMHGHCTAVAVAPSDSGNGHTYVGQTWDWMTRLAGKSLVVDWRRTEAPSVLGYGYTGLPMGAGMNSQGIALCWTSAATDKKAKLSPRVGVPSYMLIAHLLAQSDLEGVIREARRDKHAGWFTFVMADGEGNLVNIEGSPLGIAIEQPKDRLARAYYGTREMTAAKPGQDAKLHPRCEQMYKLLAQTAGKNDRETIEEYFVSRDDGIMSWKSPVNKTIDVMLFDTKARKAYLTRGPEYHLEWREFNFLQTQ